ncbi:MAG: hypothetical protein L0Y43_08220, partial [Methylococcaceae bacterium]|nr:hypothetical protein [Methylococcaceae bacterium]
MIPLAAINRQVDAGSVSGHGKSVPSRTEADRCSSVESKIIPPELEQRSIRFERYKLFDQESIAGAFFERKHDRDAVVEFDLETNAETR